MSFLLDTNILSAHFRRDCANKFGQVRIELRRKGIELPSVDMLIASVALIYDLTLVTHNTEDFRAIPTLRLDDWLTP
jgi:tRNA(fMet)-specific endonuclease VapC